MASQNSLTSYGDIRILLIGDIERAFFDPDILRNTPNCEVYPSISDAVKAAGERQFDLVCVVMFGSNLKLSSAVNSLRAHHDGKIILLSQMYEEPIAKSLIGIGRNGKDVADDYLVCPIKSTELLKTAFPDWSKKILPTSDLVTGLQSVVGHPQSGADVKGLDHTAAQPQPQDQAEVTAQSQAQAQPAQAQSQAQLAQQMAVDEKLIRRIRVLEKLATEDDLTGLKNRRYVWEFCRQIIEYSKKENEQITLLLFDIDDFKHYNDTYGHPTGDEILKQTAKLISRCCRAHDVVGRIGGDEFAVIFWGQTAKKTETQSEKRSAATEHPQEVIFIARRFKSEFEKTEFNLLGPDGKGVLTISGGLASFPRDGSAPEQLFENADKALLQAKRNGKNRIYLVGPDKNSDIITD